MKIKCNECDRLYSKEEILNEVNLIRDEIGHESMEINIHKIIYKEDTNELWIITEDRPDKSAIIGKGGWVVGKLREKLQFENIHVESYGDFLLKEYKLKLSERTISKFNNILGMKNLHTILKARQEDIYAFNFNSYFKNNEFEESSTHDAIVAVSGGVDSSFSLIVSKLLGFNPIGVTVDPGTIVLPNQFKENIDSLNDKLNTEHEYIEVDYSDLIKESFTGKFHPCGRCSKIIEETVNDYAIENNIPFVIFGDMLSTGAQCITKQNENLHRLNLPASLSVGKQELKQLAYKYDVKSFSNFGCPLLYEVHKKFPHMKKYSIQRILRETRSSALEPGEALKLIWSFYKI